MSEEESVPKVLSSMYGAITEFRREVNKRFDEIQQHDKEVDDRLKTIEEKHAEEKPIWDTVNQIGANVKKVGVWFIIAAVAFFIVTECKNIIKFGIDFINPAR